MSFADGFQLNSSPFINLCCAWDYSHEMTKHHVKKAKAGRYTPFSLLKAFRGDYEDLNPHQAKKLFIEYAEAIHGKRQLLDDNTG